MVGEFAKNRACGATKTHSVHSRVPKSRARCARGPPPLTITPVAVSPSPCPPGVGESGWARNL
eukprot:135549-Prymnesium_polylepis.1